MNSSKLLEPVRLKHGLQGWPPDGPNSFCWQSGHLTFMLPGFSNNSRDWDESMTPTAEQWEKFWQVCDEIDVWSWPPTLGDLHLCDGLQWITELEVGSRSMASRGQVHGSPPGFREKLKLLHQTLQAMVGWQFPASPFYGDDAPIPTTTTSRTGGLRMPHSKSTRPHHVAYLSIDEFFSKCAGNYCLAPNLEPHPSKADFKETLTRLSTEPGVNRCVIPVGEYVDAENELEPYSDCVFVAGPVDETVIAAWARELRAEFYREERPGAHIPREYSNDQPGWFLVWD